MSLAKELPVRDLAIYSHLVPAAIAIFLSLYTLRATKRSLLSVVFFLFSLAVSAWLVGDVLLWTFPGYNVVMFLWSWLDFVNIVFIVLGVYFFGLLVRGRLSLTEKIILLAISVPAFLLTLFGRSVTNLYQPWCEVLENPNLTLYKLFAEAAAIVLMLVPFVTRWRGLGKQRRLQAAVVALALLLFFAVFSVTEYIASVTDVYEINLYGLFVLPVFLIGMVFAITNLEVFKIRYLGTEVLLYVLILLSASQLLFLQSSTDAALSILTLGIAVIIGAILIRNERRELDSLLAIEELAEELSVANTRLHELDHMKSQFLSFASHQLKAPMTSVKWTASLIADGTLGPVPKEVADAAREMETTVDQLVGLVNEFLDLRRMEEGRMDYQFEPVDVAALVGGVVHQLSPAAQHKGLSLTLDAHVSRSWISADRQKFTQIIANLVDNAIKYTEKGSVTVRIANDDERTVTVSVIDTGHGIEAGLLKTLFEEFNRDRSEARRIEGTGLGLYLAKQIIGAHNGRIWAESPGPGKGSTFRVVVPTTTTS